MSQLPTPANVDIDPEETREWIEALESVVKTQGGERAQYLMGQLAALAGGASTQSLSTPYRNTIPKNEEPHYPGNLSIEHKLRGLVRWNALAMVMKANKKSDGIGGHISSFASSATLYEVGYNHFFKGPNGSRRGDVLFSQGHVAPGIYSRAFVEGRLSEEKLNNFRRELAKGGGLSSYPHPRLMPEFWQFPTVSMGLGPIMSMYLARYYKYATERGLADASDTRVWAYLGDGELDEPETLGNITFAPREQLENLTWVVNCNLQRLDGPVRGNASVIQETEALFRGAGWNVIKVVWGSNWDELFAADKTGALDRLFAKTVDGEYQRLAVASGADNRTKYFAKDPEALRLVEHLSDRQLELLRRGGHDLAKVYAAYHKAVNTKNGRPTVIIAKTIKGYLMGESGEAKNAAHQTKKVEFDALKKMVARYQLPLNDQEIEDLKFLPVEKGSPEAEYLKQVRQKLGDFIPQRVNTCPAPAMPPESFWEVYAKGTTGKPISTTMAYVRILSALMGSKEFGKMVVPIIPDEARTFGMEGLYRQYGIYSVKGQLYDPPDKESLTPYREVKNGQIFQEGINEAGSMASFIAAGTAYSHLGVPTLPFYQYYSMFGFQRIGDLVWAAADCKCRGFLMGGTAGRTTLNGEGLQHEDGHSHILASTVPNLQCYDPAFMYEMAVVIKDGTERMVVKGEDVFYYVTMYNENIDHPDMPKGVEEGIRRGLYKFRKSAVGGKAPKVQLMSSGITLRHVIAAADMLEEKYGLSVDVWSAPSFKRLREETLLAERWNRLHPTAKPKSSWLLETLKDEKGVFVAATDYMRAWPDMIGTWVPGGLLSLGTDGFGMSESREELRRYFEVDTPHIVQATLAELARKGQIKADVAAKAITDLGIDPEKPHGLHPL